MEHTQTRSASPGALSQERPDTMFTEPHLQEVRTPSLGHMSLAQRTTTHPRQQALTIITRCELIMSSGTVATAHIIEAIEHVSQIHPLDVIMVISIGITHVVNVDRDAPIAPMAACA